MDLADIDQLRQRVRRALRRHVLGHRRLIAGLCAGLAVLLLVQALRPSAPVTVAAPVLSSPERLTAAHPGLTVLPVRLSDPAMAALLRHGDRIDLLATDADSGATTAVCPHALVLALPRSDAGESADAPTGLTGRLVLVAVPPGAVDAVTSASVRDFLSYSYAH